MNLYRSNKKGGPTINVQTSKTVTAGTSQQTVTPDTGYDAMGEVVVNPTPSQSKSVTAGTTTTTVTPDSGKLLSSVSIAPTPSTPITPSSSGTQFSAGLNNMSSSGWAYSSQPSGGTIKVKQLKIYNKNANEVFTLDDSDKNMLINGKGFVFICIEGVQNSINTSNVCALVKPRGTSVGLKGYIQPSDVSSNYSGLIDVTVQMTTLATDSPFNRAHLYFAYLE